MKARFQDNTQTDRAIDPVEDLAYELKPASSSDDPLQLEYGTPVNRMIRKLKAIFKPILLDFQGL